MARVKARTTLEIDRAIEVFARGFAFTRSFTHPAEAVLIDSLWVVRDTPRRRSDYRREEWIAHAVDPTLVDRIARRHTRGRFSICAIHGEHDDAAPLRAGYKSLGYRVQTTEPFMIHDLRRIPQFDAQLSIERVRTADLVERLNRSAGRAMIKLEHLERPKQIRVYAALAGDKPIGWVRSIMVGDTAWCASVFVHPSHRRRRVARSMLVRMLREDRAAGASASVLLASHTGALLYPVVGYRSLGTLIMFNPPRDAQRG